MKYEVLLSTEDDTIALAAVLAKEIANSNQPWIIGLDGPLAAGKTFFSRALFEALGADDELSSPSYALIQEYKCEKIEGRAYHLDLYRLSDLDSAEDLGLREIFANCRLAVIEWAGKFPELLPNSTCFIALQVEDEARRAIITGKLELSAAFFSETGLEWTH